MKSLVFVLLLLYGLCLILIFLYSLAQLHLTLLYRRTRKHRQPEKLQEPDVWPVVTVQLPVFNELYVVERLIDCVAAFDYPHNRLQIQVLDDSTDETVALVAAKAAFYRKKGLNIEQVRRPQRTGFKAGALQFGLRQAIGEFIAIFDADFLPAPDFLKKTIPAFATADTGVVQTRWGHINENYSLLTQLQAFGLNGHFVVEQGGRNSKGHFINFNGTAGVWRRSCIEDAGGWHSDTLTEDLDLSYRAQLKGWKFRYLEEVEAPAELPATMPALKSQQYRWTKGAAETARKHLGKILPSRHPLSTRLHALVHLLNSSIFLCVLLTALLSVPMLFIKKQYPELGPLFKVASLFLFSLLALLYFYWTAFRSAAPPFAARLNVFLPKFFLFLSMSMGLSLHNALAVAEGYLGRKTPFIRTPKFNIRTAADEWKQNRYNAGGFSFLTVLEGLLAVYFCFGMYAAFLLEDYGLLPFHLLLATGYGSIFLYTLRQSFFFTRPRKADNGMTETAGAALQQ